MSIRFSRTNRYLAAIVLLLALTLVACFPFGRRKQAEEATATTPADQPSDAIEVATLVPTFTPTRVVSMATPTPTVTPVVATSTPTVTTTLVPAEEGELTTTPTVAPKEEEEQSEAPKATVIAPARQAGVAEYEIGRVIRNGSFEEGFDAQGVAYGWNAFSATQDGAVFAWQDEPGYEQISHGDHAQLMRIMGPGKPNQFVGIYQTMEVVAGETYTVALHGVIRSSTASDDYKPLAFRLQWAVDDRGGTNWTAVEWQDWTELGWTDVKLDKKWPEINAYVVHITPQTDKLTLFIRGWSKWPLFQSEVKFYVDGVFVDGPVPHRIVVEVPAKAPAEAPVEMPTTGGNTRWIIPILGAIGVLGLALWEARKLWAR